MNIITPYRTVFFNLLNKKLKTEGKELKILFTSEKEGNRARDTASEIAKFEFKYEILNSKQLTNKTKIDQSFFHINKGIIKKIKKENPEIIIHAGWAALSARQTCNRAKKNKKKFILRSGSTKLEKSRRRTITKPLVKWLVKNSSSYRSYGTRASEYLESLGAAPKKIFKLYNTVDISFFMKQAEELKLQKEELKKHFGIKEKNVVLFIGRLIQGKGVFELLNGFKLFQKENKDFALVFVGSGPEEDILKKFVKENNINSVYFMGYQQKTEISKYFTIADIFTLPSYREVRGLVINEAMCFGLPILSTNHVGASKDLITKTNGVIIELNSVEIEIGLKKILERGLIRTNSSLKQIKDFEITKIVKDLKLLK